jgi:hypothetical protein
MPGSDCLHEAWGEGGVRGPTSNIERSTSNAERRINAPLTTDLRPLTADHRLSFPSPLFSLLSPPPSTPSSGRRNPGSFSSHRSPQLAEFGLDFFRREQLASVTFLQRDQIPSESGLRRSLCSLCSLDFRSLNLLRQGDHLGLTPAQLRLVQSRALTHPRPNSPPQHRLDSPSPENPPGSARTSRWFLPKGGGDELKRADSERLRMAAARTPSTEWIPKPHDFAIP